MTPSEALRVVLSATGDLSGPDSRVDVILDLGRQFGLLVYGAKPTDDDEFATAWLVLAEHAARRERDRKLAQALEILHTHALVDEVESFLAESDNPTDG